MTDGTAIATQLALLIEWFDKINKRFDKLDEKLNSLQEAYASQEEAAIEALTAAGKREHGPLKGKPARVDRALGPTVKFTVEELFDVPELKQSKQVVEILVPPTVVQVMESKIKNPEETLSVAEPKQPGPQILEAAATPTVVQVVESKNKNQEETLFSSCDCYVAKQKDVVLGEAMDYHSMVTHRQLLHLLTMSFVSRVPQLLLPCRRMDTTNWSLRTSSESRRGVMIQDYG